MARKDWTVGIDSTALPIILPARKLVYPNIPSMTPFMTVPNAQLSREGGAMLRKKQQTGTVSSRGFNSAKLLR